MCKVSAIVVTFNRLSTLKSCLKYLFNQNYDLNNIIIINNASTDGTKIYLNNLHNKNVIVKNMSKNVGGSGGFSAGIRLAYEKTNSDLFWLMDDDTLPTPNSLFRLIQAVKHLHNHFGFLCSNVRWWKDNTPCNVPEATRSDWNTLLPSNLVKVNRATFVSFMVSRQSVASVGLPVRQMFIWGDDAEYSFRLNNINPCYFVSNSIVIHNTKSSPHTSMFNMPKSRDKYLGYGFRNELYAYRKDCSKTEITKKIFKELCFIVRIPFLSKKRRLRKLYYTILGFIKGLFFNPKIEFPKNSKSKEY